MANQTKLNIANGWVSIYRSLSNSPLWLAETFTRGQAWVDILMLTNHTDGYLRVRGNRVDIKRGQLGWSKTELGKRWNWSTGKVRRFFNELEKDKQIVQQESHLTSIVTVLNYSHYQHMTQQTVDKRLQNDRQTAPNNKENKENKVNNEKREFNHPAHETIISYFINLKSTQEEAMKFMDYYASNGWRINKNPMKDWQAAARNWIRRVAMFNEAKTLQKPVKNKCDESDFDYIPAIQNS
ncbi:MAG: hypothetical protein ACWA6U_13570 [Breznakibacter sp.]